MELLSICRESCEHSGSFRPCVCFMLARPPGRGCKKCPPHHQAWARWSLDETRSNVSCHWNLFRSSDHLSPFRPLNIILSDCFILWNNLLVLPGSHMLPLFSKLEISWLFPEHVRTFCIGAHPDARTGWHIWHGLGKRLQNLSAVLWCNLPRSKRRCHIKVPSPGSCVPRTCHLLDMVFLGCQNV